MDNNKNMQTEQDKETKPVSSEDNQNKISEENNDNMNEDQDHSDAIPPPEDDTENATTIGIP